MPDDGTEVVKPPTPVWRIADRVPQLVSFGGQLSGFVCFDDMIVAVCQLPDDPVVKKVQPGGSSLGYHYPASVVIGNVASSFERIGTVDEFGGRVWRDGTRVLLAGFDRHDDDGAHTLRAVDLSTRRIDVLDVRELHDPIAFVPPLIADIRRRTPRDHELTFVPLDGNDVRTVAVPNVAHQEAIVVGGTVWMQTYDAVIVGVNARTLGVRTLDVTVDCSPYLQAAPSDDSGVTSVTLPVGSPPGNSNVVSPTRSSVRPGQQTSI